MNKEEFGIMVRNKILDEVVNDDFIKMVKQNIMPFQELITYYKCAIMEIETKFKVLNEQFSLQYERNPIETIKTRLKSNEGIAEKLRRKNLPFTMEAIEKNIKDVAGVRVICSFQDDIYRLADYLLQQDDITLLERKDFIKHPKDSGYRSLHLIVEVPIFLANEKRPMKVEVQLRTIAMDFWASLEHKVRYKKNINPKDAEGMAKELYECAEISASLDLRMEAIKNCLNKN